ncbi:hypothetical protein AKJ16_DCAP15228 [Drosera capensis]
MESENRWFAGLEKNWFAFPGSIVTGSVMFVLDQILLISRRRRSNTIIESTRSVNSSVRTLRHCNVGIDERRAAAVEAGDGGEVRGVPRRHDRITRLLHSRLLQAQEISRPRRRQLKSLSWFSVYLDMSASLFIMANTTDACRSL